MRVFIIWKVVINSVYLSCFENSLWFDKSVKDVRTTFCYTTFQQKMETPSNSEEFPLTLMARKYTTSNKHNFDICLPVWLGKNTKVIYTTLFVLILVLLVYRISTSTR
ncbi:MAG: hypothetical protein WDO15_01395 [Bacteroidota bacterium]